MFQEHKNIILVTLNKLKQLKSPLWLPLMTSSLEMQWAYSKRKR